MALPMQLKLTESLNACERLRLEVLEIDLRLKIITRLTERCKLEAKRHIKALTKCMEEKTAMKVNFSRLFALMDQLKREFSSYRSDLIGFVDSWVENKRKSEELLAISQQEHRSDSEEEKLRREMNALNWHVQCLSNNLNIAKQESDLMGEELTVLREILDNHPVTIEGSGGENSNSSHPTKKAKLEENAGSSIGKPIYIEDSSDGKPPHPPQLT